MTEQPDMTPVTRAELREELTTFEQKIEQKIDQKIDQLEHKIDKKLETLTTKTETEHWVGALIARMARLDAKIDSMRFELNRDLAQHITAAMESLRADFRAVDDKYDSRVSRLETAVFPPEPRARTRRRKSG